MRTPASRVWEVLTLDHDKPVTSTGAPRVVKGKVVIGNAGGEFGVRGYLSAYDADERQAALALLHRSGQSGRSGVETPDHANRGARPGTASGGSSAAAAPSGMALPTTRS